jgi:hypothetical protein
MKDGKHRFLAMVYVILKGRKLDKTDKVKEGAIQLVNFFLYFLEVVSYCWGDGCVLHSNLPFSL